jgi:uncharacterized protein YegP (UPF0339 family)
MSEFEIYKDKAGEYRWRLRSSGSNKIIADSGEGYIHKHDCLNGIKLVQTQSPIAAIDDKT